MSLLPALLAHSLQRETSDDDYFVGTDPIEAENKCSGFVILQLIARCPDPSGTPTLRPVLRLLCEISKDEALRHSHNFRLFGIVRRKHPVTS